MHPGQIPSLAAGKSQNIDVVQQNLAHVMKMLKMFHVKIGLEQDFYV